MKKETSQLLKKSSDVFLRAKEVVSSTAGCTRLYLEGHAAKLASTTTQEHLIYVRIDISSLKLLVARARNCKSRAGLAMVEDNVDFSKSPRQIIDVDKA